MTRSVIDALLTLLGVIAFGLWIFAGHDMNMAITSIFCMSGAGALRE